MAVNKKLLVEIAKIVTDGALRFEKGDDEALYGTPRQILAKIEEAGVYFRNSGKLCISDWKARSGVK